MSINNNVTLVGRLTYEPELKTTINGVSVINFQVAAQREFGKKGENGKVEYSSDFVDCTAFRNTAEFISKYFHKGSPIIVKGFIQTNTYADKDGTKRKSMVVVAENVSFLPAPAKETTNTTASQSSTPSTAPAGEIEEIDDDDLPF